MMRMVLGCVSVLLVLSMGGSLSAGASVCESGDYDGARRGEVLLPQN